MRHTAGVLFVVEIMGEDHMTRKTSAAVYNEIETNGLLSERRWNVYKTLYLIGPATAAEISNHDESSFLNPAKGDNSHARLNELKKMGCVDEVGTKKCDITGREVLLFDITDKLPIKIEKPKTRLAKCQEYIVRLLKNLEDLNHAPIHGSEKSKRLALLVKFAQKEITEI